MDLKFLPFSNVRRMSEAMAALQGRGAGVPGLGLVHGSPGRGKTEAAIWYAGKYGARYLVANPLWSPRWMLNDLYIALRGMQTGANIGTTQRAFDLCLDLMSEDNSPVLIDEADLIAGHTKMLEALRLLHDKTKTPVVFCGTDVVAGRLAQHSQFWSRVSQFVPFQPLSVQEVTMAAKELAGLTLDADGAARLHGKSKGLLRDVIVALSHLERAAKSSKTQTPAADQVEEITGRALRKAA